MRLPARFRLKAFPQDNQLWKVDWFGDLVPNPNAKSEPLLEIFIVPFRGIEITQETLKQRGYYDYNQFRKIKLGISLLPFLHLGTFWQGGIHQTASLSERVILRNLKIDTCNTRITAAKNFTAYKNLISFFPSIKNCPETALLEIDFPNDSNKKILIPSYEVIRFYFAGSSELTRSIISGGLRSPQNALFDPAQTSLDEDTCIGKLILRKRLTGTDRYNVARLAFSKIAANAAWGIYSSIVKNYNNNDRRIVEASLPFVGETNLQVCGKWFKQDDVWHFLVYFIESCSHPLPYNQLIWGIEGDDEINTNPQNGKGEQWIKQTINENQDDRNVGSEDEPDLQSVFKDAFFEGQKFTDLENKVAEKQLRGEKTKDGIRYRIVEETTDETRELSTGSGTFGESSKQGLNIKIDENEESDQPINEVSKIIPAGWELFTGILNELERKSQIKTKIIEFVMQSDSYSRVNIANGIYFPVLVKGKNTTWSFLDKMQTRRQAMLAEILIGKRFFYLFDTEVKTDDVNDRYSMMLIYEDNYAKIEEPDWRLLLSDAAKFRGGKRNKWGWNKKNWLPIRHDLNHIEKYTERLQTLFRF